MENNETQYSKSEITVYYKMQILENTEICEPAGLYIDVSIVYLKKGFKNYEQINNFLTKIVSILL